MQKNVKKTRVNVSLTDGEFNALKNLAGKHGETLAGQARQFILKALEIEEDLTLAKLAKERDKEKDFVKEEDFWG